jgi:hypothetical protein
VFTIPAYPAGTTGEIEYLTNLTVDGVPNHHEGTKKIQNRRLGACRDEKTGYEESITYKPSTRLYSL